MNCRRPLRIVTRLLWFGGLVCSAFGDFLLRCVFGKTALTDRALWLHRHTHRVLKMFRLEPQVSGPIPSRGLLISNHLSYLDILVISSITPAVFVAKREVKFWPVLGLCAQMAGTLFVDRTRKLQVVEMNKEIGEALDAGVLVVLFPEGTSSNGQSVLPFKSALLEPAAQSAHPLFVGCIQYSLNDGDAGDEICYWGDHTFFPHMLNLMGKQTIRAAVRFAPFEAPPASRKELAFRLREEVVKLKVVASITPPAA
ncbi:MAG TPA: lysophospholipid acyltransferase family protein [Verrucomicrobiae bacterium]|nr:lysophospholipid acyltransferase family protein [Verrucomicrobiae bacterium]